MKRIAIIGGGISGLSAAFALEQRRRAGQPLEYVVFESSARFGGVILTERVDGCVVEAGPDSFLSEKPWAAELCRQLGLDGQLIGSNDSLRKTYMVSKNRLVPLPDGLMFLVPTEMIATLTSPLFSLGTKARIAQEWLRPPPKAEGDESVASLVKRHYGSEMVERLADPLVAGVYGGEASQLSARAVLPRLVEMESTQGSLGRAMMARRRAGRLDESVAQPIFSSLKDGMQRLVDGLLEKLPASSLRANTAVRSVLPPGGKWRVCPESSTEQFDAVIFATSAPGVASLLQGNTSDLRKELQGISYSSSVTVALGYGQEVRSSLPPGFGFLVPRSENKRMLAATFVHNKFPHRAPEDRALIRCFLGGVRDEAVLQLCDEEILGIVRAELRQILGLTAEPRFTRLYKWRSAMAQYQVGHLGRLDRIERLSKQLPGLALAGNGYRGIGVPDCVHSGKEAAAQV
jgi:protoporphyrinogen/coproporphyrinogen III oxidase